MRKRLVMSTLMTAPRRQLPSARAENVSRFRPRRNDRSIDGLEQRVQRIFSFDRAGGQRILSLAAAAPEGELDVGALGKRQERQRYQVAVLVHGVAPLLHAAVRASLPPRIVVVAVRPGQAVVVIGVGNERRADRECALRSAGAEACAAHLHEVLLTLADAGRGGAAATSHDGAVRGSQQAHHAAQPADRDAQQALLRRDVTEPDGLVVDHARAVAGLAGAQGSRRCCRPSRSRRAAWARTASLFAGGALETQAIRLFVAPGARGTRGRSAGPCARMHCPAWIQYVLPASEFHVAVDSLWPSV